MRGIEIFILHIFDDRQRVSGDGETVGDKIKKEFECYRL